MFFLDFLLFLVCIEKTKTSIKYVNVNRNLKQAVNYIFIKDKQSTKRLLDWVHIVDVPHRFVEQSRGGTERSRKKSVI